MIRAALAKLFGFEKPAGGNVPGYPDTIINMPYRLERLAWDYPKAMRQVATVRACVLRVANDLAQLPIVFERQRGEDWEAVPRQPGNITDVWASANDEQTSFELVRDMHAHLKAAGNAYLVAETFGTKRVHELWLMHPHLVRVIPGARRSLRAYVFDRGGKSEIVPGEYVVHLRAFNPDFEPVGSSDLESVEQQYSTRYDIGRLMSLFVRGGGTPAGFFKVVGPDGRPSAMPMSEPDKKEMQDSINRVFNGIKNAFRPKIMSQVEWARMGLTPKEMDLIEQSRLTDEDICRALGVPPWMVGIKDASTLGGASGAASADRGIYIRNTLLPEVAFRDGVLTERLCPMFEVGVRARTDLSAVTELMLPLLNAATQSVALAGGPILTPNEMRKMFGQPADPAPESDLLRKPAPPPSPFGAPPAQGAGPAAPETAPAPTKEAKAARMIDGDAEREMRRKQAAANVARYERRMARMFHDILQGQQRRIVARIEASGALVNGAAKRALDPEAVLQPEPDDVAALERLLAALVADRGEEALAELALAMQLDLNSARAASYVHAQAERALSLVDATTRAAVREQIAAGLAANESTGQIAERIRQMPEFGQDRALMIARTETTSAFNFASLDAYEQSGVVDGIEWLSARDSSVRDSHAEADGQVASLGMPFSVGGYPMSYPGDPSAPPGETVNCRCTTLPVVNEKARSRRQFTATLARLMGQRKDEAVRG